MNLRFKSLKFLCEKLTKTYKKQWCLQVYVWTFLKYSTPLPEWQSGLDCGVTEPCSVCTGVPSLCQPQASDTKASPENVCFYYTCVCVHRSGWATHRRADICSFQGSRLADNRLGKQPRSSGSPSGSSWTLHLCQISEFIYSFFFRPLMLQPIDAGV